MAGVIRNCRRGRGRIIRLRSLGDCVLTTPASPPESRPVPIFELSVVAEERFSAVFVANPDVDQVLPPSVAAIRRWRPDICVNLHGGTRSIALTAASGARWRAGFEHFRASAMYNVIDSEGAGDSRGRAKGAHGGTRRVRYVLPGCASVSHPAGEVVCG